MTWSAVVAALDDADSMRSRVSVYLHPLAGTPVIAHVVDALLRVAPPPDAVKVLFPRDLAQPLPLESLAERVCAEGVARGQELTALRAAVTAPGMTVLVDGAAPLIAPPTVARLLRAAEQGLAVLSRGAEDTMPVAVAGEGPALASADDPRRPRSAVRIAPTSPEELIRIADRHTLAAAAAALRDRLVRRHEEAGVTFLLPATVWVDAEVQIGADTIVYPGVVIEGRTEIGTECVIGPHSRLVDATIGRGVELKGWNYVARTSIRNHAVLEPYVRRGYD